MKDEFIDYDFKRQEMASDATLRDYFASNAMIGLFSNADMEIEILTGERHHLMAELSYKMADAMLEARNK